MRTSILYGLLAVALATAGVIYWQETSAQQRLAILEEAQANETTRVAYAEAESKMKEKRIRDRVIHLPEDGNAWYVTLVLSDDWKTKTGQREMAAWFDIHPELASLKRQTHFQIITPNEKIFPEWAKGLRVPAVCVTTKKGKAYYRATGNNIPADPDRLASEISDCFPKPNPNQPAPFSPLEKPAIPDMRRPDRKPIDDEVGIGLVAAIAAAAAGAGYLLENKKKA